MAEAWLDAETTRTRYGAKVAGHDYAHHGWYFRVLRQSESRWLVQVRWGRRTKLRCCQQEKRTYVPEKQHRPLDKPKPRSRWLAKLKQEKLKDFYQGRKRGSIRAMSMRA